MVKLYEDSIEDWYMHHKHEISLTKFLCEQQILKSDEKCN